MRYCHLSDDGALNSQKYLASVIDQPEQMRQALQTAHLVCWTGLWQSVFMSLCEERIRVEGKRAFGNIHCTAQTRS